MIEIYKKLSGTNCGKCGVSTCMAFAQKVETGGAQLTDCPFIDKDIVQKQPSSGSESFSDYDQVSKELEKEAIAVDFNENAETIGGTYEAAGSQETIRLRMLGRTYELRKDGLFVSDKYCPDPWTKIIIYDYVRRKGSSPLTGDWITLGHFPHTASHVKAFQSNAEKKIADTFGNDLDGLKKRGTNIGGIEGEGKTKADYFCTFNLLPLVPLYLAFYSADEEFDAECKILFDANAENHLDIEYLAILLERFVEELV